MDTNLLPHFHYQDSDNPTHCCPRFDPAGWDRQQVHFRNKLFVRARTRSFLHIPLNMGRVFTRIGAALESAGAIDPDNFVVLSRDLSPWQSEHLFAVTKEVAGQDMLHITGDYTTRVFEGPYRKAKEWHAELAEAGRIYFFYTTCPKCAKYYGKNYVVAFCEESP